MAQPMRVMPAGACGTMLVNAKVISAAAIATTEVIVNAFARMPCLACAPFGTDSRHLHDCKSAGRETNLLTKNMISIT